MFSVWILGNCVLFVETLDIAFDIDVKGFKQRSVDTPNNEIVIKGPHEAFVENLRTNTSLIRRIVNNENLIIEKTKYKIHWNIVIYTTILYSSNDM